MGTDREMTTWNYCNRRGQVRETDTGLLVADIPLRPNAEALGALAAAAPELLAALEAAVRVLENECPDWGGVKLGRAAIAKATGGEGSK